MTLTKKVSYCFNNLSAAEKRLVVIYGSLVLENLPEKHCYNNKDSGNYYKHLKDVY